MKPERTFTPLSKLIRDAMDEHGWLVKDCVAPPNGRCEGGPTSATLSWYRQPEQWMGVTPREKTIREIATAIRVPVDVVRTAAIASLRSNMDAPSEPAPKRTPSLPLDGLTPEDQRMLRDMAQRLRSARKPQTATQ